MISCYILWWFVTYKCQESINCICCILLSLLSVTSYLLPLSWNPLLLLVYQEESLGGHYPTLGKPSAMGTCWDDKGKKGAAKQPAHFMANCGKEKGRCWSHSPVRASASHPRTSHQALPASHSPVLALEDQAITDSHWGNIWHPDFSPPACQKILNPLDSWGCGTALGFQCWGIDCFFLGIEF